MKVAITGHTSGLGKSLYDAFSDVIGFSRSNGFDINKPDDIISKIDDCDVFINNAYDDMAQIDLLYLLYEQWKNTDKIIINISSNSSDGIKKNPHKYAVCKAALDKASEQLCYSDGSCRVINIRPGWIDTPRVSNITDKKIDPYKIVKLIKFLIDQNDYIVKEITILPQRNRYVI